MPAVTVFTAARMLAIEGASVVSGAVSGDNLILTKRDGSTINAGNVRGLAATLKGAVISLIAQTEVGPVYTVVDDNTPTAAWPNREEWWFQPSGQPAKLVAWHNEYGEMRGSPAKNNTVPLRVFSKISPTDGAHSGPLIEVQDDRTTRTTKFSVDADGNVVATGTITRTVPSGPTLSTGYIVLAGAAAVPAGTPAGTLIIRT